MRNLSQVEVVGVSGGLMGSSDPILLSLDADGCKSDMIRGRDAGAVIGGVVGGGIGAVAGFFGIGPAGVPLGGKAGTVVGAGVGALVGGAYAAVTSDNCANGGYPVDSNGEMVFD